MSGKLEKTLSVFKHGERVKIIGRGEEPYRIYNIEKISKYYDGNTLYILRSKTDFISRLHYEIEDAALERLENYKIKNLI